MRDSVYNFDYSISGMDVKMNCNYPSAPVIGEFLLKGSRITWEEGLYTPFMNHFLKYTGPFNVTVDNMYTDTIIYYKDAIDVILISTDTASCNPQD
jgi:hypothetical protein